MNYKTTKPPISRSCDEYGSMILSTFRRGKPHRLWFLTVLLICQGAFLVIMTRGNISKDIVPGARMPDAAFGGYTPEQARAWYKSLDDSAMTTVLFLGLLDIFGIIPSYTLLLGSQLAASGCPDLLCYVPLWTASFDLIESLTHFSAVLGRYLSNPNKNDSVWSPSSFHLVIASGATQFKAMTLTVTFLLVALYGLKSTQSTPKPKKSS
jgi:hypothetical protein